MEEIKRQALSSVAQAPLDNFGRFNDDEVEGAGDDSHGASIFAGAIRLKFTNTAQWETAPDGDDFTDRELVAINIRRMEVCWGKDGGRPKTREVMPGERFRDLDALNATIPKSEWRESFGSLKGPWERQYILEFIDLADMQRYYFPTSTIGGSRCIRELDDRVKWMRRYRGENVYPTVRLTHTFMSTNYGGRERPHLEIRADRWIKIGGGEAEAVSPPQAPFLSPQQEQATPPPRQEQVASEASPPQAQAVSQAETLKTEPVNEPTLQEELNDKVPF
jgi:hypothetical protein